MAGSYIKKKIYIYIYIYIYVCVCVGGGGDEPNSYGGGLRRHRQIILERYALNLHLGYQTIFDENAEDTYLISDGRGTELEGAWGNLRGNKGNLVLN